MRPLLIKCPKKIKEAYETISDRTRRDKYDCVWRQLQGYPRATDTEAQAAEDKYGRESEAEDEKQRQADETAERNRKVENERKNCEQIRWGAELQRRAYERSLLGLRQTLEQDLRRVNEIDMCPSIPKSTYFRETRNTTSSDRQLHAVRVKRITKKKMEEKEREYRGTLGDLRAINEALTEMTSTREAKFYADRGELARQLSCNKFREWIDGFQYCFVEFEESYAKRLARRDEIVAETKDLLRQAAVEDDERKEQEVEEGRRATGNATIHPINPGMHQPP